jgi:CSLREA domain-containing protein
MVCVSRRWGVLAALLLMMMTAAAGSARAATFTVNTSSDTDDGTCDGSHSSLREAITAANAAAGPDTIAFNLLPAGNVHVIVISGTDLPVLQDDLVIDGYTQPGASPNTSATGGLNTQLRIEVRSIWRDRRKPRRAGSSARRRALALQRHGRRGQPAFLGRRHQCRGHADQVTVDEELLEGRTKTTVRQCEATAARPAGAEAPGSCAAKKPSTRDS